MVMDQYRQVLVKSFFLHNIMSEAVFEMIKPTYISLTNKALLQRCLRGATQSRNEAFRRPGTLFISHENANFLFSVFRVVQGEAKTPKIMGCCRANFAFLHALKIGTFRGK